MILQYYSLEIFDKFCSRLRSTGVPTDLRCNTGYLVSREYFGIDTRDIVFVGRISRERACNDRNVRFEVCFGIFDDRDSWCTYLSKLRMTLDLIYDFN